MKSQTLEKSLRTNKNQATVDHIFTKEDIIRDKIRWALNTA